MIEYRDDKDHSIFAVIFDDDSIYIGVTEDNNPLQAAKLAVSRVRSKIKNNKECHSVFELHLQANPHLMIEPDYYVHDVMFTSCVAYDGYNQLLIHLRNEGWIVLSTCYKNAKPAKRK